MIEKYLKYKKYAFSALFCIAILFMIIGCQPKSWNYKMTVTVETPEGIETGYAVRKVTMLWRRAQPDP